MSDPIPSPAPFADFDTDEGPAVPILRPGDWLAAQREQSGLLARAAAATGRLDATLAAMNPDEQEGAHRRLALIEIESMLWAQGTPLQREEIGREMMDARAGTDLDAMRLARWGLRRLEGQASLGDLRGFLGLHRHEGPGLAEPLASRMVGRAFDEGAVEYLAGHAALEGIEPIARAPALRSAWRLAELSAPECLTEPACWTGRDMAEGCEALKFVPLGRGGRKVWVDGGPLAERMRRHLEAVLQGATEARRELKRISDWAERARQLTASIKGENPARVITVLAAHPLMTTAMVEAATGFSRDTAERLLARMHAMGVVREITGARRYRLWAAGS
ncbi:DUF1403 family protein [Paracoccus aestuariivivens]|uniref:DUF1403 family protein n=1 Tax=Paracoccus aestuariivivens TaxID=1820333 RepID=A0A6L6JA32_9RHOB|nr:DUF1403 family protein [Paracoccus aestuariivivens]MTH76964.1 DUF1403 family protein [Paracoccus aestuariivivens]